MTSSLELTGACLCKAITVEIPDAFRALRTMCCHCLHCQKAAGGPCQTNAVFESTDVKIRDQEHKLTRYVFAAEEICSGFPKEKCFCSVSAQHRLWPMLTFERPL